MAAPGDEIEVYAFLHNSHLQRFIRRLQATPPGGWDWAPAPPVPSARILAEHVWQWLVSDRQHLTEPDGAQHAPVPEPPATQNGMCALLQEEAARWQALLGELTPEQLARPGRWFGFEPSNGRGMVRHSLQHVLSHGGELGMLWFLLGLEGTAPYSTYAPNAFYADPVAAFTALRSGQVPSSTTESAQSAASTVAP
jgi:hypothetical protein